MYVNCKLVELILVMMLYVFFFFNDTATTEIYTLSLHDALPIYGAAVADGAVVVAEHVVHADGAVVESVVGGVDDGRSEEHTSELQSPVPISYAVFCLKKKNKTKNKNTL